MAIGLAAIGADSKPNAKSTAIAPSPAAPTDNRPAPVTGKEPAPSIADVALSSVSPPRTGEPLVVSSGELFENYTANAAAADAKYLNKRLRVDASVVRVQDNSVELFLLDNYKLMAVFRSNSGLSKLKLGDEIVMECTGGQARGMPTLSDCVLADVLVSVRIAGGGSIDDRREVVKKLKGMGFTARATGDGETTLEMTSRTEGCKLSDLTSTVESNGYSLFYVGFTKLRCLGKDVGVDLIDDDGKPVDDAGLTARRLFSDYKENEISADAKYKGQTLRVSGKVTRIGKDVLGDPFVDLATENQFMGVLAKFLSADSLVALKRGHHVAVRCIGVGLIAGSPVLDRCTLAR